MKIKGGFRTDERFIDIPDGSWVDARNILLEKGFESISNENGNIVAHLISGYLINGVIATSKDTSVIFSVDIVNNFSQIGILDSTNTYTPIIIDTQNLFNFSILNPIEGVFKFNFKGDLIIAWSDGINLTSQVPKILNLTTLPFPMTGFNLTNPSDINLARLFPEVKVPEVIINSVNSNGGQLKAGDYYFTIAYEIENNDLTNFLLISREVAVANLITQPSTPSVGDITPFIYNIASPGTVTSVSINLTLNNLDTTFKFFRLISISKLAGIVTAQEIGRFNTLSGSLTYVYTGRESTTSIDLTNVLVNTVSFAKVKTMTDFENRLYFGNFTTNESIKYQKFANNIKLKYSTTFIPTVAPNIVAYEDLKQYVLYHGYQPEEIYAYYIHLILKDGSTTTGFHIPGRDVRRLRKLLDRNITYSDWSIVAGRVQFALTTTPQNGGSGTVIILNGHEYKSFTFTATTLDLDPSYTGTFSEPHGVGVFNTYSNFNDNSSELENDLITDGSGLAVAEELLIDPTARYHELYDTADEPDINNQGLLGYWENQNEFYPVTNSINNLDEYNGAFDYNGNPIVGGRDLTNGGIGGIKVKHHKMIGENRINGSVNFQNTLIIGIRFDNVVIPPEIESQIQGFYFSYVKRDFNNITILANDILLINNLSHKFYSSTYSFSLLTSKPQLNPSYVRHVYTIDNGFTIINYPSFSIADYVNTFGESLRISTLEYHPDNNSAVFPSNANRVETISLLYTNTSGFPFPPASIFPTHPGSNTSICIINLVSYVKDIYVSFYNQKELCSTGKIYYTNGSGLYSIFDTNINNILFGGDTFVSEIYSKIEDGFGSYNVFPYYTYSPYLTAFREKDQPNWNSYYGNHYQYNTDFSSLLDIKQTDSFNVFLANINIFPYRVHRSNIGKEESLSIGWRTFLANAYFEMPKSKGEIWKLASLNKELLIHMKFALYVAKVRDRMATDINEIFLGISDVFDREPDEMITTPFGYVGNQSQWASFVCKIGYVCIDREQGKIFIYNGKISEISIQGQRNFLMNNLDTLNDIDNPFYINNPDGGGITAGYDEKNERIVFCKKDISDSELSITMSYSIKDNIWICKHDYFPNHIFSTRNKFYFIQNLIGATNKGRILEHNVGNKGNFFDDSAFIVHDSYIDVIFKNPQKVSKIFDNIEWKSEIIKASGVDDKTKTITAIMIYTNTQCSGIIPINTITGSWFTPNTRNVEETWKFNDFRDIVKDKTLPFLDNMNQPISGNLSNSKNWFDKNLFIDKFVIIRFIYNNLDNNDIYISEVDTNVRESAR